MRVSPTPPWSIILVGGLALSGIVWASHRMAFPVTVFLSSLAAFMVAALIYYVGNLVARAHIESLEQSRAQEAERSRKLQEQLDEVVGRMDELDKQLRGVRKSVAKYSYEAGRLHERESEDGVVTRMPRNGPRSKDNDQLNSTFHTGPSSGPN